MVWVICVCEHVYVHVWVEVFLLLTCSFCHVVLNYAMMCSCDSDSDIHCY